MNTKLVAERWPGQTPEGVPAMCADQSFGLDFWLPFYQEKGRRTSIIAWTLMVTESRTKKQQYLTCPTFSTPLELTMQNN